jgi:homoserine dehydrogenase
MLADLALIGFGNVARRFVQIVDERRDALAREHGLGIRIVGISTRRHGLAWNADGLDTRAAASLIESQGVLDGLSSPRVEGLDNARLISALSASAAPLRVVVETTTLDIASGRPAIDHVRKAIEAGCHTVTANKGPAAFSYGKLRDRAASAGVAFLFEGAVMDGVPIFNLVRHTLPSVGIRGFRGVVNSTTNHILTALEDGEAFGPALARMQAEGIAEADPSLDIDGWDAAAKTAALANVLFDAGITPQDVDRQGIGPECAALVKAAIQRGARMRLVASAARGGRPSVRLTELPDTDLLARLRGMSNALIFDTELLGDVAISQLHGGLTHTAYALLSDLIAVRRRH